MRNLTRAVFGLIAIACAALVAYAIFYMQEELGLEPCPMCAPFRTIAPMPINASFSTVHPCKTTR